MAFQYATATAATLTLMCGVPAVAQTSHETKVDHDTSVKNGVAMTKIKATETTSKPTKAAGRQSRPQDREAPDDSGDGSQSRRRSQDDARDQVEAGGILMARSPAKGAGKRAMSNQKRMPKLDTI